MDTAYLKSTVGEALAQGLTAVAVNQPDDAVDYLGNFLLQYVQKKQIEAKYAEEEKAAFEAAEKKRREERDRIRDFEVANAAVIGLKKEEEHLAKEFEKSDDLEGYFSAVLEMLKKTTKASAAYLVKKFDGDGGPRLIYTNACQGSEWLIGKSLAEGVGVIWDLWKEKEDGTFPPFVNIDNVVREPRVAFFRLLKLGAFLAVPVTYQSVLHEGSVVGTDVNESSKVQRTVSMALCFDTLGAGTRFFAASVSTAQRWANILATNLERAESSLFDAEVQRSIIEAEERMSLDQDLEVRRGVAEQEIATGLEGIDEGREERELELRLLAAKRDLLLLSDKVVDLSNRRMPPKAHAFKLIETILLFSGVDRAKFVDSFSGRVDWQLMRLFVDANLVSWASEYDPNAPTRVTVGNTVEAVLSKVEAIQYTAVNAESAAYGSLLLWAQAAAKSRRAAIAAKAAVGESLEDVVISDEP